MKVEEVEAIQTEETKEKFSEKVKRQAKLFGNSVKETAVGVKDWVKEHPYETIGLLTAVTALGKMCGKTVGNGLEERRRNRSKYDPQTGSYVKLRRPLTAKEQVELAERRQNGESVTLILDDFGLLKR